MWDSEQYIRGNIVLTKMLSWGKWPATACGVCRFNLMYSTLDAADCLALEGYSCLSWQQEGIIFFLPVRASDFPIETSFPTSEKKKKKTLTWSDHVFQRGKIHYQMFPSCRTAWNLQVNAVTAVAQRMYGMVQNDLSTEGNSGFLISCM